MGSRWAAALGVSAVAALGFAGAAFAGTGSVDCNTVTWKGDGTRAEINGVTVPVAGSMPVELGKTYTINWFGPSSHDPNLEVTWSTAPTVLHAPTYCGSATSIAPTTTAAPVPTTAPAAVTSTTAATGLPPVATTAPANLDLTTASQRLPETGRGLTLAFWGAVALTLGTAFYLVRGWRRPVSGT